MKGDRKWHIPTLNGGFYVEHSDGRTSELFSDTIGGRIALTDYIKECRRLGLVTIGNVAAVEWTLAWDDDPSRANTFIGGAEIRPTAVYRQPAYIVAIDDPAVFVNDAE